jgi:beta-glucosidase
VRFDTHLTLPDGADPGERLMRPPQRVVPVPLSAGGEVDLVLRHEPLPAGGFGQVALPLISFQLLVAADTDDEAELAEAAALAGEADVAVVVVSTTEEVESEGLRPRVPGAAGSPPPWPGDVPASMLGG